MRGLGLRMDARREAAAWLSVVPAALHVAYAAGSGIHPDPVVRWLLALGTVAGSWLVWRASRQGPWPLAWLGLAFIVLPAVPGWPIIGVSPGGLLALLAMAVAGVAVLVASWPAKPRALSPSPP